MPQSWRDHELGQSFPRPARFADGYCALAVLSMAALNRESAARAEATRLSENPGHNLRAIAQVILGTGFGAATARALASGLMLVRKATAQ